MAKRQKKPDPPPAGLPGWMATYADMVTLLLTFFVLMMAMANFEDVAKVNAVMASIREALGVDGFDSAMLATMDASHLAEDMRHEEALQPIVAKLRQAMGDHVSDDFVRVTQQENEIRLKLDDRVFFRPGSTTLHPSAYALIADVGRVVAENDCDLLVEGHSDASGDDKANWELSALRAVAVVRAVETRGPVPGDRLSAVAYGSNHPASEFDEDEAWNRRIEFVIRTDDVRAAAAARAIQEGGSHGR